MPGSHVGVLSDDRLLCDGVVSILRSTEPSFVVEEFDRAKPFDILLIDSRMGVALTLCSELKRECGSLVIMVAADEDDRWAACALSSGARGILLKRARTEEMVKAIRAVSDGLIWAPRRVMVATIDYLISVPVEHFSEAILEQRLSGREREVFRHTAHGLANKEVAVKLGLSEATVKAHLTHIFQKLGVRCRAELAAAFHGIVLPATST